MLFLETNINNKTLMKINKIISNEKFIPVKNGSTQTFDGFQTENIISFFSKDLLKEIVPFFNFFKNIFHIHYILYNKNGYQGKHNHSKTENFSFILYLNNATGNTDFFIGDYVYSVKPIKNKLIVFSSEIFHLGNKVKTTKQILVGAIEKNEKK
jgi:hypothetical protein